MKRTALSRGQALKARKTFQASPEQRRKVKGEVCVFCGRDEAEMPIDPMHVVPRSRGGCDSPDCILPGCRECHRLYDNGKLDLLRIIVSAWPLYKAEFDHATTHLEPIPAIEQMAGARVEWREAA